MPLHFRIDPDANRVITTASGRVTADDLVDHARALAKTRNRPTRELVEFLEDLEFDVPTSAVREMANYLAREDQNSPGSRVAMVATADAVFGLLRLFGAYRDHPNVTLRTFRDRDEAVRWLDGTEP